MGGASWQVLSAGADDAVIWLAACASIHTACRPVVQHCLSVGPDMGRIQGEKHCCVPKCQLWCISSTHHVATQGLPCASIQLLYASTLLLSAFITCVNVQGEAWDHTLQNSIWFYDLTPCQAALSSKMLGVALSCRKTACLPVCNTWGSGTLLEPPRHHPHCHQEAATRCSHSETSHCSDHTTAWAAAHRKAAGTGSRSWRFPVHTPCYAQLAAKVSPRPVQNSQT